MCNRLLSALAICLLAGGAWAGEITQVKPLDFGVIALRNNDNIYNYQINPDGSRKYDSNIVVIEQGHPAEFLLSGFQAGSYLHISTSLPDSANSLSHGGNSGSRFTIKQLNVKPWVRTNAKGEARVWIGATLATSGTGNYLDAKYINPHITLHITH